MTGQRALARVRLEPEQFPEKRKDFRRRRHGGGKGDFPGSDGELHQPFGRDRCEGFLRALKQGDAFGVGAIEIAQESPLC